MPSYPRNLILSDACCFHITWQCHNKSWLLERPWAKRLYYQLLLKHKQEYGVDIYAYNFMDSHPHLAGYCQTREGLSNFMRRVNGIFARKFNKIMKRCGQVVMDRFRSPQIETDTHLLSVMTYIDLNPVRAKMVADPSEYQWTSFHFYAYGTLDQLITPAPSYLGLASTPHKRQQIYREMISELIATDLKRRNYSTVFFIGNPDWVIERSNALLAHRKKPPQPQAPPVAT